MVTAKQTNVFPVHIIAALFAFLAIGCGLAALIPSIDLMQHLSWIGVDERRLKLGLMTYLLLSLTAVLLWLTRKAFKLSISWFMWAMLFNGLIIIVKFISSPNTYGKLDATTLWATAIGVALFYTLGVWCVYQFAQGKILKSLSSTAKNSEEIKFLFAAGLFVCINFLRIALFSLPLLAKTATATYLSSIFQGGGLILSVVIFLIILGAVETFDLAKHSPAALRNTFILTVSLLVVYHFAWAIFVRGLGDCGC